MEIFCILTFFRHYKKKQLKHRKTSTYTHLLMRYEEYSILHIFMLHLQNSNQIHVGNAIRKPIDTF